MAKTIETMGAMWPQFLGTTFRGFDDANAGTLAPKGFAGNEISSIIVDTADDSVDLVLATANTDLTAITFSANYVGQVNVAVTLTTVDGITFTGTSADMQALISAAVTENVSINTYIETTDTSTDTGHFHTMEHGASAVPPVHHTGSDVRVGSAPKAPISYPNKQDGWDSADLSTPHYPV